MTIPSSPHIRMVQYLRNVRRLEALHAGHVVRGAKTWQAAIHELGHRLQREAHPVKRATILRKAISYLNGVTAAEKNHIMFACNEAARSAGLCFAAFNVDLHPFTGVEEEGLHILQHVAWCDRHSGFQTIGGGNLAYVSAHAIERLYERGYDIDSDQANGVFAFIGVLGHLVRYSPKHAMGELNLRCGEVLVTGALKHSVKPTTDGRTLNGNFLDVRTVLVADEVRDAARLEQGQIAAAVVAEWFGGGVAPGEDEGRLAERIPYLPRRGDDYPSKAH